MADRRSGGLDGDTSTDREHGEPQGQASGLDRVDRPDPRTPPRADLQGKRALFSVDPDATPTPALIVRCRRCEVERSLGAREALSLFRPPWVANPITGTMWTRCPTCRRRAWLEVRLGPGIPWPLR